MYKKEKCVLLKGSTSALANNLSVQVNLEKGMINYAVVHKSVVNLVSQSTDGTAINHRQILCKEPSSTHGNSIILQARLVQMPTRMLLVITSQKGIQMFEADGSIMLYWYAIGDINQGAELAEACFSRGICGVMEEIVCVGTHNGEILVFYVPSRGTNITLSETLRGNKAGITDLESEGDRMVSADDRGQVIVWQAGDKFQQLITISGAGTPCSSIGLWNDVVVCGYGSGHIRVFNASSGKMSAEVAAHARWINAIDVAKNGLVLSASEDSHVRIWQLKQGSMPEIEYVNSECVADLQLQGARFINDDGRAFGVTGYDSNELIFYRS